METVASLKLAEAQALVGSTPSPSAVVVAQLVERETVNLVVVGSTPTGHLEDSSGTSCEIGRAFARIFQFGLWGSLVSRLPWTQEIVGSNPTDPTE